MNSSLISSPRPESDNSGCQKQRHVVEKALGRLLNGGGRSRHPQGNADAIEKMTVRFVGLGETRYRNTMNIRFSGSVLTLVVGLFLAACSGFGEPPYIWNAGEFNREDPSFGAPLKNRESVTICYAKHAAAPKQVADLAVGECRRYGKTAVFREQTLRICPMMTPVAAIYDCRADSESSEGRVPR